MCGWGRIGMSRLTRLLKDLGALTVRNNGYPAAGVAGGEYIVGDDHVFVWGVAGEDINKEADEKHDASGGAWRRRGCRRA